jgi:hypothetical protein
MKIRELADIIADAVNGADHPEIVSAETFDYGPEDKHSNHNLVRVNFASGAQAFTMVRQVSGPGIPRHEPYTMPREVF